MAPPTLYLGPKVSVDTNGHINFTNATLTSKGSTVITLADMTAVVQRIDSDIAFMRDNSDAAALDSLTEIVQRAANIDASLNAEISGRVAAVSAEETARTAADTALGIRVDNEQTSRATADTLLGGRIDTEISDRAAAVSAEATARATADTLLGGRIDTEISDREAAVSAEATARSAADADIRAISIRSTKVMPMNVTVYADAQQPKPKELVSSLSDASLNYDGWYFRNDAQGNKINWYVSTDVNATIGDVKAIMLDNHVIKKTSPVFLTIYTARSGTPGEVVPVGGSSWYKCRLTYIVNNTGLLSNGKAYRFVAKLDNSAPDVPVPHNHTSFSLTLDEFSSRHKDSNGNSVNLSTDKILFFSIGTDSSSSAGNVEFIASKFSIQRADGVHEHLFTNDAVSANFYRQKLNALYTYFFNKDITGVDSSFIPSNV